MLSSWIALLVLACFLLATGRCTTPTQQHTVHIGTQATIVGYESDYSPTRRFLGIPYAQPISNRNRFRPPQRKGPRGQMMALHYGSPCWQPLGHDTTNNAEDCLFLNIWTPKIQNLTSHKYPVYFFIHGGGYQDGSGAMDMENIAKHDVIGVTINYRLNAFGFFTTRDSNVPGNFGLQDQIEALNWVKRYISYFGGDPNMITIGGHSAGGMSVSLLSLSPVSQHLFQRAILHSGTAFSNGWFSNSVRDNHDSKALAVKLGCITADSWHKRNRLQMKKMLRCLQRKTPREIRDIGGFYIPYVDGPGGVIPERLEVLAQRRPPIPMLIGDVHDDRFIAQLAAKKDHGILSNNSVAYLHRFTRQYMINNVTYNHLLTYYNNSRSVGKAIKAAYIDSSTLNDNDHIGWAKMKVRIYSDMQFIGASYRDANLALQTHSPVYLYSFDYLAPWAWPTLDPRLRDTSIAHGWELQYVYGHPNEGNGNSDDAATQSHMETFWTNFMKYGNPTPAGSKIVWPRMTVDMDFMSLGPHPKPSSDYHPTSRFFACNVPAIEGRSQSWCT